MCIVNPESFPAGVERLVGFKVMERIFHVGKPSTFRPVFSSGRDSDHREFSLGVEYDALISPFYYSAPRSGFHALVNIDHARRVYRDLLLMDHGRNVKFENLVIVVAELSDNLVFGGEGNGCMAEQIRGRKMKILYVLESKPKPKKKKIIG